MGEESTQGPNEAITGSSGTPQTPQGGNAENSVAISDGRKKQLAALRRHAFPKGVSGNPGGRPKGIFGKAVLRQLCKRGTDGQRMIDALAEAQVELATRRSKLSTRAAVFVRDTVDGPPVRERQGVNDVGTVNILWNCPKPDWAVPPDERAKQSVTIESLPLPELADPLIRADAETVPPSPQLNGKDDGQQQDARVKPCDHLFVPSQRVFIAGHRPDCQCAECAAIRDQMRA